MKARKQLHRSAPPTPLDEDELSAVSGGGVSHSELVIQKLVDKASPKLYEAACKGSHIPEVNIVM